MQNEAGPGADVVSTYLLPVVTDLAAIVLTPIADVCDR